MAIGEGAVLRVVPTFDLDGASKAQNVYHFQHTSAASNTDEDVVDACGELIDELMGNLTDKISEDVSIDGIDVYELVGSEWQPVGEASSTWTGSNVNERLPSGVALLIKLYKSRSGHADRKYIAGMTEVQVVGDTIESGVLTACAGFVTDMTQEFTATNGVELTPVYFNRTSGLTLEYTSGAGQAKVSYQRRRKPGVGLT